MKCGSARSSPASARAPSYRSIAAPTRSCTGAGTSRRGCSSRRRSRAGPIRCATSATRKAGEIVEVGSGRPRRRCRPARLRHLGPPHPPHRRRRLRARPAAARRRRSAHRHLLAHRRGRAERRPRRADPHRRHGRGLRPRRAGPDRRAGGARVGREGHRRRSRRRTAGEGRSSVTAPTSCSIQRRRSRRGNQGHGPADAAPTSASRSRARRRRWPKRSAPSLIRRASWRWASSRAKWRACGLARNSTTTASS